MNDYQIFISYRRDGGEFFAKILCDKLIAKGYRVFFDVEEMKSGTFNTQLYKVIEQCKDFILILSPNALDRCTNPGDWLYNEISFAIQNHKNIIPIVMRDFQWPKTLPKEISELPIYENEELARTSSHEHIDASVNRICNSLLISRPKNVFQYHLAEKEYYKITLPLFNTYKCAKSMRSGFLNVRVHLCEEQQRLGNRFRWQAPGEWESYAKMFEIAPERIEKWYQKYHDRIENLQEKAIALKCSSDAEDDLYFYCNAVFFMLGLVQSLPMDFIRISAMRIIATACYCLDLPYEEYEQLSKVFGKNGYKEFCDYLPLALEAWPSFRNSRTIDSEARSRFDQNAILLFEFMLECALLLNDTCKDERNIMLVRVQILCYYKWLRKNKLYLPREIQEKIHHYL